MLVLKKGGGQPHLYIYYYLNKEISMPGQLQYIIDTPYTYKLWDKEKNTELSPENITVGSGKKAWWKCALGHSWKTAVSNICRRKSQCPYCVNQKILPGFNDLATTHPEVLKEWDESKNLVSPSSVGAGSGKKAWWKCDAGHSWEAVISTRAKKKVGCPYCSGKRAYKGFNDLATTHPELAQQWDWENNGDLGPENISAGSEKKVFWKCDKGHSYDMSPYNRTSKKPQSCPYCSGKRILRGYNDLAATHPELVQQWDEKKNGDLTPDQVSFGMGKKVWWECDRGHSWDSVIISRAREGTGCPVCSGQKILAGHNDLATLYPAVSLQWCNEKNTKSPSEVSPGSSTPVWWECDLGHQWKASPINRTRIKSGCPYCSGNKVKVGFNDLQTVSPHIAAQWDDEKNGDLKPSMVSAGSGRKAWFICDKGHSWQTVVAGRKNRGCPHCVALTSRAEEEVADYVSSLVSEGLLETSNRSVISPYELDIYIPELHIAIEFNGLYWHTEKQGKDKSYHYNKWKMCQEKGIQLITIWEDEWRDKKEIVKSMLAHKLGASKVGRVYARKTELVVLHDKQEVRTFLDAHHIQGFASGSCYLGLADKNAGQLVAVSVWRKNKDVLYLDRYATSCTVVGGMGKMLKDAIEYGRDHNLQQIVTFSDHCISDGALYEKLGFTQDKELAPDYRYLTRGMRKHKFGYRLKKFRDDPNLVYQEGLTEKELAKLNGLERIWDCGKTRWVMDI